MPRAREWRLRTCRLPLGERTLVMGVLNVTPDSFSDGSRFLAPDAAVARAKEIAAQGADLLDIGGESTRPGAAPVAWKEEWSRIEPVLQALSRKEAKFSLPISVDTRHWQVAELALERRVEAINDVGGMREPKMRGVAAEGGAGVVVMHMLGDPRTMQSEPRYADVVKEVAAFLKKRVSSCVADGIARERVCIDPGVGFGKTTAHNLSLIAGLPELRKLGQPLLVGASRKSFISKLTGRDLRERLPGSLAAAVAAVAGGADIVRVHDVAETVDALKVADPVLRGLSARAAWDESSKRRDGGGPLEAGRR
jgi:dihydropteroate synthase